MARKPKIYLSPAAHASDNQTKCTMMCSENTHCNQYTDVLEKRLITLGFEVKRGDRGKTGKDELLRRIKEANAWGADLYYVVHTNAGGGRYSMTMCWPDDASRAKAQIIHKYRKCVKSHKVVDSTLDEIRFTMMTCLYDELFFHDNAEDCAWFHNGGMQLLAEETAQALCEMHNVTYMPPVEEKPKAEEKPVATPSAPTPSAPVKSEPAKIQPKAGDVVSLDRGKLYHTARGGAYVTRTGTFYFYDGVKVGNRYRVTNKKDRVGKRPVATNVSGWVEQ